MDTQEYLERHEEAIISVLDLKYSIPTLNKMGFNILLSGYVFPLSATFFKDPDPLVFTGLMAISLLTALVMFFISDLIKYRKLNALREGYFHIRKEFLDKYQVEPVTVHPYYHPYSWIVIKKDYDPFLSHPRF